MNFVSSQICFVFVHSPSWTALSMLKYPDNQSGYVYNKMMVVWANARIMIIKWIGSDLEGFLFS